MSTYNEVLGEYNKLKEDFDEHKKVAEEYERELEETIKDYELRSGELKDANEKLIKELSKLKQDYLQYKEKNFEKMKDIQFLEGQVDKMKQSILSSKEEKSTLERKIIIIENENNDYLNKARELECWADELKNKLEAALEENIILHNENEMTKSDMQEAIQRLQEELEESKNEILSKEQIINRITMHRDFLLKTAYNVQDDFNNNVISSKSFRNLKKSSSTGKINVVTPVNKNVKIPEKFFESYSKSYFDNTQEEKAEYKNCDLEDKENLKNETCNLDKRESRDEFLITKENKTFTLNKLNSLGPEQDSPIVDSSKRISFTNLDRYVSKELKGSIIINDTDNYEDEEDKMFIKEKIDMEVKNILDSRRNFLLNTLTMENFSFDYAGALKIIDENISKMNTCITNTKSKGAFISNNKNQKIVENIDEMLSKIQARKEKVLMQKKMMQNKLEKIGIKIS